MSRKNTITTCSPLPKDLKDLLDLLFLLDLGVITYNEFLKRRSDIMLTEKKSKTKIEQVKELYSSGHDRESIAKKLKITYATAEKYINEVRKNMTEEKYTMDEYWEKGRQEAIQSVLDDFDFERVHMVMTALDWKWDRLNAVPTIEQMRGRAGYLLNQVKNSHESFESGGFVAESCGSCLTLYFKVTESEAHLEEFI